jgi:hypothetical protein
MGGSSSEGGQAYMLKCLGDSLKRGKISVRCGITAKSCGTIAELCGLIAEMPIESL